MRQRSARDQRRLLRTSPTCLILPGLLTLHSACSGSTTDELINDASMISATDSGSNEERSDAGDLVELDAKTEESAGPDANDGLDANTSDARSANDAASDAGGSNEPVPEPLEPGAIPARPYLTRTDSPFEGIAFEWFHLEDFEDHQLNTPGLSTPTAGSSLSSAFGSSLVDSVDADDNVPDDDRCVKIDAYCDAYWGPGALTMVFDPQVLGALPTHAGAVWTDGEGMVGFEAFDSEGELIYSFGPYSEPGFPDDTVQSSTGEDRFFGAYAPQGIASIRVYNTGGGVEVDHVQYGRAVAPN